MYPNQVCFISRAQAGSTFQSQSMLFIMHLLLSIFTTVQWNKILKKKIVWQFKSNRSLGNFGHWEIWGETYCQGCQQVKAQVGWKASVSSSLTWAEWWGFSWAGPATLQLLCSNFLMCEIGIEQRSLECPHHQTREEEEQECKGWEERLTKLCMTAPYPLRNR